MQKNDLLGCLARPEALPYFSKALGRTHARRKKSRHHSNVVDSIKYKTQVAIWHCENHQPRAAVCYCPTLCHTMLSGTFGGTRKSSMPWTMHLSTKSTMLSSQTCLAKTLLLHFSPSLQTSYFICALHAEKGLPVGDTYGIWCPSWMLSCDRCWKPLPDCYTVCAPLLSVWLLPRVACTTC